MFSKFDEESKKVLTCSKKEMQELKHEYIGTEHVMLSILRFDNSVSKLLYKYGVNYKEYKKKLIDVVGIGNAYNSLFLYTPLLKRVLENCIDDSRKNNYSIALDDIFCSIIEEGDGVGLRILFGMNVDIDSIYADLSKNKKKIINKKSVLNELGVDLNIKAKNNLIDPVVGRDSEIDRLIEILCRRTKNNPILIGDAGVGKTAIVEGLASRIVNGNVPDVLKSKRIISLDMASSVAGTKYRGEFEDRMKNILSELENDSDIILFIDEIHTIMGAGGAEGAIDASNIFKPALARGNMRCIGATTTDEYRRYIESDSALDRRFQKLEIKEPNKDIVKDILMRLKPVYEKHHNVILSEKVIDKIIMFSNRYIKDRNEPDKSIDILDEVCSRASLRKSSIEEKLRKLKIKLKDIISKKNNFIVNNKFELAYKLKIEEDKTITLINELEENSNDKPRKVIEKDIKEVIKSKINIPILELDDTELDNIKRSVYSKFVGNKVVVDKVLKVIKRSNVYEHSAFSILLCGKKGIGKTLLSSLISRELVGNNVIKLDMNEFIDASSISKIIGYVGYNKSILDEIRSKPNSILILDEIENCNRNILNLFMQGRIDGYIMDIYGRKVPFSNVSIFMTADIDINNSCMGFNSNISLNNKLKNMFDTKLLSYTNVFVLDSLTEDEIELIIRNKISDLSSEYGVKIIVSDKAIKEIIDLNEYGLSKLEEIIKDNILDNEVINIDSLNITTT